MGKKVKKETRGDAAKYMTRSQALRRLQVTLKDFRRLCILKGIFPKEPKRKFKGMNKTYYLNKDIRFLANEELLRKFKEITAFNKKITKAKARKEESKVNHYKKNKPNYTIDHIIKERYPRFIDALHDLDDALCLVSLYGTLPKSVSSTST
jgi:pescadillo protein